MAAVKRFPIYHFNEDYVFRSLRIIEFIKSHFQNSVLLKPVLGLVAGVNRFITGHEQSQSNRVRYSRFFGVFLASKESKHSEINYFLK